MSWLNINMRAFWPKHIASALLGTVMVLSAHAPAQASGIPFPARKVEIKARGEKVSEFLRNLFGQAGLSVKVSSAVTGNIQGNFIESPGKIWEQLSKSFQLVAYYDGSVVLVYSSNEIRSRTISAGSPQSVVNEVRRLNLVNGQNNVTAGAANVVASGVPAFVERVEALAARSVAKAPAPVVSVRPVVQPRSVTPTPKVAVATTDVISPIVGKPNPAQPIVGAAPPTQVAAAPMTTRPAGFVRSTIRSTATARYPYEIRVFYLRYAQAVDTRRESGGAQIIIPGIVTQLRGIMGDGRASTTVTTSGNFERGRYAIEQGVGMGRVGPNGEIYDGREGYRDEPRAAQSEIGDINGPRIEADVPNNAVIIRDRPEAMPTYESLIAAADIEPTNIELVATIIELNTTRARKLDLDLGFSTGGIRAFFGGTNEQTKSSESGTIGGSVLTGPGALFTAKLTALERNGTARVVSKPQIIALNNLEALFSNETEQYVSISSERVADLRVVRAGLVLRVTPNVVYDGGELRTRLTIFIQDGAITIGANGAPSVSRAQLNTYAVVKQGEAIIVGGMTVSSQFDEKSKVPIAGDIPVVGNAFKKRNRESSRYERLFLITPRIMSLGGDVPSAGTTPASLAPVTQLSNQKPPAKKKDK